MAKAAAVAAAVAPQTSRRRSCSTVRRRENPMQYCVQSQLLTLPSSSHLVAARLRAGDVPFISVMKGCEGRQSRPPGYCRRSTGSRTARRQHLERVRSQLVSQMLASGSAASRSSGSGCPGSRRLQERRGPRSELSASGLAVDRRDAEGGNTGPTSAANSANAAASARVERHAQTPARGGCALRMSANSEALAAATPTTAPSSSSSDVAAAAAAPTATAKRLFAAGFRRRRVQFSQRTTRASPRRTANDDAAVTDAIHILCNRSACLLGSAGRRNGRRAEGSPSHDRSHESGRHPSSCLATAWAARAPMAACVRRYALETAPFGNVQLEQARRAAPRRAHTERVEGGTRLAARRPPAPPPPPRRRRRPCAPCPPAPPALGSSARSSASARRAAAAPTAAAAAFRGQRAAAVAFDDPRRRAPVGVFDEVSFAPPPPPRRSPSASAASGRRRRGRVRVRPAVPGPTRYRDARCSRRPGESSTATCKGESRRAHAATGRGHCRTPATEPSATTAP